MSLVAKMAMLLSTFTKMVRSICSMRMKFIIHKIRQFCSSHIRLKRTSNCTQKLYIDCKQSLSNSHKRDLGPLQVRGVMLGAKIAG